MAESTHTPTHTLKDDGKRLRLLDKMIRGEGVSPIYTRSPQLFDHFTDSQGLLGANFASTTVTTTATKFTTTYGGGNTGTVSISKTASGGIATITLPAVSGLTVYGTIAGTQVMWEPEELATGQKMLFEARVRVGTLAGCEAFWGLADSADAATRTGSVFTVSASSVGTLGTPNAFCFGYSSAPTSGVLDQAGTTTNYFGTLSSVTGTTTVAVASTGVGGDALFHTYTLLVDKAGNVDAFIDDVFVGYTQFVAASGAGVNPTIAFTPYIQIYNITTATHTLDVDYITIASAIEGGV